MFAKRQVTPRPWLPPLLMLFIFLLGFFSMYVLVKTL